MADFFGKYEFSLDDRGRVSVPSAFRDQFTNSRGLVRMSEDGCVELYTMADFKEMANDVTAKPRTTEEGRQLRREFAGEAFPVELDRQGRILIPPSLREEAALSGPVILVGALDYFEIWNRERYPGKGSTRRSAAAREPG